MATARRGPFSRLVHHYPLRIAGWYVLLGAVGAVVWRSLPEDGRRAVTDVLSSRSPGANELAVSRRSAIEMSAGDVHLPAAWEAILAASGALLLALPVAWAYMFTRPRKGYRQSVAHTLVLMPVIVAGIVVLVKNSLALAFGLAAIVGAVRFRNTLDDSRDTIFVLAAMALGLAAAVRLDVAIVMSVTFNVIVLVIFYTDFARTPPALEGVRAQRHMERVLATANRTSQFVAVVDDRILQSLAPAQLDALAERVRARRGERGDGVGAMEEDRFPTRIEVTAGDLHGLRDALEPILDGSVKRWRFLGSTPRDGAVRVEYGVKMKKGMSTHSLADIVRAGGAPHVAEVSVV